MRARTFAQRSVLFCSTALALTCSPAMSAVVFFDPSFGGTNIAFNFENLSTTNSVDNQQGNLRTLTTSRRGVSLEITRTSGRGFDILDISGFPTTPLSFGGRTLSPFPNEQTSDGFLLRFDVPVKSVSITAGDFGQDTPDFIELNGSVERGFVVRDSGRVVTDPNNPSRFISDSVSINDGLISRDGLGYGGFFEVFITGGTSSFPHSLYYDNITVSRPPIFALATDVAKRQALVEVVALEASSNAAIYLGASLCAVPPVVKGCAALAGVAAFAHKVGAVTLPIEITKIINDPPRFDYDKVATARQIALPDFGSWEGLPDGLDARLKDALADLVNAQALTEAWLITLERYQGAAIDGNEEAMVLQQATLEQIIMDLSRASDRARSKFASIDQEVEAIYGSFTITPDDIAATVERLRTDGFSAAELAAFAALELTSEEIEVARAQAISDLEARLASNLGTISSSLFADQVALLERLSEATVCAGSSCLASAVSIIPDGNPFLLSMDVAGMTETSFFDLFLDDFLLGSFKFDDLVDGSLSVVIDAFSLFTADQLRLHGVFRNQPDYAGLISNIRSEALLTETPTPIPLPASGVLLIGGLFALGLRAGRTRSTKAVPLFAPMPVRFS